MSDQTIDLAIEPALSIRDVANFYDLFVILDRQGSVRSSIGEIPASRVMSRIIAYFVDPRNNLLNSITSRDGLRQKVVELCQRPSRELPKIDQLLVEAHGDMVSRDDLPRPSEMYDTGSLGTTMTTRPWDPEFHIQHVLTTYSKYMS